MKRSRRVVSAVLTAAVLLLAATSPALAQVLDLTKRQGQPLTVEPGQPDAPADVAPVPEAPPAGGDQGANEAPEGSRTSDPEDQATGAARSQGEKPSVDENNAVVAQEGDRDCPDFDSQQEAQEFFEEQGGPDEDPDRLDADDDDIACETLGAPTGGVDTGGGGTAVVGGGTVVADSRSPLGFVLSGAAGGLLFAALVGAALRRRIST